VVAVFAAAVLLQAVAQSARLDAQLAVPQAWEPERDVPRVAQHGVQAAQQAPDALRAAHWDAWRADQRDDSVVAHSAASLVDPQAALPVPGELLAGLPAAHSDVSPGDPQVGQPDDCLAVRLAGDH
jgi:hypothetical protein